MALAAQMVDGKVVANYTTETKERKTGNDSLDKDAFLQILVAEMQYQDPLEPSSNTDWVSQMASFSQIEELQGMSNTISEQSAANLVGKKVIIAASEKSFTY
jgi:flagellar basal-body rod modification protein FlgD